MKQKRLFFVVFITLVSSLTAQTSFVDSLINSLNDTSSDSARVSLMNKISYELSYVDLNRALTYADSALVLSKEKNFNWGIIDAKNNLGFANIFLGDFDKSHFYINDALILSENLKDTARLARSYNIGGNLFFKSGKLDRATEYYQNTLKLSESIEDKNLFIAANNGLGIINLLTDKLERAIECFQRGLESTDITDNQLMAGNLNQNIGTCYKRMEKYELAAEYHLKALEIARSIGNKTMEAHSLNNLGSVVALSGDLEGSIEYILLSLKIKEEIGNKLDIVRSLANLGEVYSQLGNTRSALKYLKRAETIIREIESWDLTRQVFTSLSKIYDETGEIKKAFDYYKMSRVASDSLNLINSRGKISELEKKYENEKLEKENTLLKQANEYNDLKLLYQLILILVTVVGIFLVSIYAIGLYRSRKKVLSLNAELSAKNSAINMHRSELADSNATKDKLFSIIAHDLRNPFSVFVGTSEMLLTDYDEFSESERKGFIEDLYLSLKRTHGLLENLLYWARSQREEIKIRREEVNLRELAAEALSIIKYQAAKKKVRLEIEIFEAHKVMADPTTIKLVLLNLVSNALKFTPTAGKIEISSVRENENIKIFIKDTGVGIEPDRIENLFSVEKNESTFGTNNEKGTGLGLPLCKELIEKNGGSISIESTLGKGTSIVMHLRSGDHH